MNNSTSFKDRDISTLYSNTPERVSKNNQIVNFIRQNSGTTPYRISKEMKLSYSQVAGIVRDLEY